MSHCRESVWGVTRGTDFMDACAAAGIVLVLDPDNSRFEPPSPAPVKSRGPRKSKSPKVAKPPSR
jgi:hypothetical protein